MKKRVLIIVLIIFSFLPFTSACFCSKNNVFIQRYIDYGVDYVSIIDQHELENGNLSTAIDNKILNFYLDGMEYKTYIKEETPFVMILDVKGNYDINTFKILVNGEEISRLPLSLVMGESSEGQYQNKYFLLVENPGKKINISFTGNTKIKTSDPTLEIKNKENYINSPLLNDLRFEVQLSSKKLTYNNKTTFTLQELEKAINDNHDTIKYRSKIKIYAYYLNNKIIPNPNFITAEGQGCIYEYIDDMKLYISIYVEHDIKIIIDFLAFNELTEDDFSKVKINKAYNTFYNEAKFKIKENNNETYSDNIDVSKFFTNTISVRLKAKTIYKTIINNENNAIYVNQEEISKDLISIENIPNSEYIYIKFDLNRDLLFNQFTFNTNSINIDLNSKSTHGMIELEEMEEFKRFEVIPSYQITYMLTLEVIDSGYAISNENGDYKTIYYLPNHDLKFKSNLEPNVYYEGQYVLLIDGVETLKFEIYENDGSESYEYRLINGCENISFSETNGTFVIEKSYGEFESISLNLVNND